MDTAVNLIDFDQMQVAAVPLGWACGVTGKGAPRWTVEPDPTLRVEFSGKHIRVIFDGVVRIEMDDAHIAGAGAVGLWTKADSVTAFDDFAFKAAL